MIATTPMFVELEVKEICRFIDEDSETIGRDVLRLKLFQMLDRVNLAASNRYSEYQKHLEKQAEIMAETARRNVRLEFENNALKHFIGLDRCRNCIACEDEIDVECPFSGEPGGCNNRECQQAYLLLNGDKK